MRGDAGRLVLGRVGWSLLKTSTDHYLAAAGLDGGRFDTVDLGEGQPVASDDTEEGRRLNRRVQIRLLEKKAP